MSEELKPCPFCGGAPERIDIEHGENAGGSCISCTVCQASSNVEFEFKENFVSNWNRRPHPMTEETKTPEREFKFVNCPDCGAVNARADLTCRICTYSLVPKPGDPPTRYVNFAGETKTPLEGGGELVEPSNAERADWPDATRAYVEALEAAEAEREETIKLLQTRYLSRNLVNMVGHALKEIADSNETVCRLRGETDADADLKRFVHYVDHAPSLSRGEVSSMIDFAQGQMAKLAASQARQRELEEALRVCKATFERYAQLHYAKKTAEGDDKGMANQRMATANCGREFWEARQTGAFQGPRAHLCPITFSLGEDGKVHQQKAQPDEM